MSNQQVKLENPPNDTVSDLAFSKQHYIAASSWDNSLRLWLMEDVTRSKFLTAITDQTRDAILRCDFNTDSTSVFYGTARGEAKMVPLNSTTSSIIGKHQGVITGLKWSSNKNCVVTSGTDCQCLLWDTRDSTKPTQKFDLPAKPIALDCMCDMIGIALVGQKVALIDMKAGKVNVQQSQCTTQLTCIALAQNGQGYLAGCLTGIIDVKLNNGTQSSTFATGRNEQKKDQFAANCIATVPDKPFAIVGGSHGNLEFLNLKQGKRSGEKPTPSKLPVTALSILDDNSGLFVYATGYDWSRGAEEMAKGKMPVELGVRKLTQQEMGG